MTTLSLPFHDLSAECTVTFSEFGKIVDSVVPGNHRSQLRVQINAPKLSRLVHQGIPVVYCVAEAGFALINELFHLCVRCKPENCIFLLFLMHPFLTIC